MDGERGLEQMVEALGHIYIKAWICVLQDNFCQKILPYVLLVTLEVSN